MKKVIIPLLFAVVIVAFSSCTGKSPQDTVKNYLNDVKAEKYNDAIKYIYFDKEIQKEQLDLVVSKMSEAYGETGGIDKYEIISETIHETSADNIERAEVTVKVFYKDGEEDDETYRLIKIDGSWKIDATM